MKEYIVTVYGQRDLTEAEIRSRENMRRLAEEYIDSSDMLKERIKTLQSGLECMPLCERRRAELRIALLEQEVRESRRTGAEAGSFYTSGHRFLTKQNRKNPWKGAYLC